MRSVNGVPRASNVIEYDRTFVFAAPAARLWATMGRFERYPAWWSWLREFTFEGTGLEVGTVLHGVVVPPLPYRMRLDVVVEECVPEQLIAARVHGDLEGVARLTFAGDEAQTHAHATWSVEMMQRPMRLAARFAYPLLNWGHDRVVDVTVDGFRGRLGETGGR